MAFSKKVIVTETINLHEHSQVFIFSNILNNLITILCVLFNRDLNHGCLLYMFSVRFSGSKFLVNLRWQFRVRKIFSCT